MFGAGFGLGTYISSAFSRSAIRFVGRCVDGRANHVDDELEHFFKHFRTRNCVMATTNGSFYSSSPPHDCGMLLGALLTGQTKTGQTSLFDRKPDQIVDLLAQTVFAVIPLIQKTSANKASS